MMPNTEGQYKQKRINLIVGENRMVFIREGWREGQTIKDGEQ